MTWTLVKGHKGPVNGLRALGPQGLDPLSTHTRGVSGQLLYICADIYKPGDTLYNTCIDFVRFPVKRDINKFGTNVLQFQRVNTVFLKRSITIWFRLHESKRLTKM
jgi:hypothetical protein